MYHIPGIVENIECNSTWWKMWKLCKTLAKFLAWKKLFSKQFEALKTFVSSIDALKLSMELGKSLSFQMAPLVDVELSQGHHGFSTKPVTIVISLLVSLMEDQFTHISYENLVYQLARQI